ncbi:hypothetical protein SprV_0301232600 [Sparganum proliferum]
MQGLRGEPHIDDKLFKEMFLERLPADVQTILPYGSEDLSVSRLAETAVRMLKVTRFQPPSVAQFSISPLPTPSEQIATEMAAMEEEMASIKFQLARLTSNRSSSCRRSRSRPRTAYICWYHTNFGARARRCSSLCSLKSKQENQSVRE